MRCAKGPKYRKHVKDYGFLSFARKFGNEYGKKTNGYCNKNRNGC